MNMITRLAITVAIAASAITVAAPAAAETTIKITGLSYHFDRDYEQWDDPDWRWNERNPGLGIETSTPIERVDFVAGFFRNSYHRDTVYAGARWSPLTWRSADERWRVKAGFTGAVASGYDSPVVGWPTLSIDRGLVGVELVLVPHAKRGFIGVALRLNLD